MQTPTKVRLEGLGRRRFELPWLIDHTVAELVAQRMLGLALGYEDLNDREELSKDPLLAALVGKTDPTGERRLQSRGQPLASASKLGRLERTMEDATPAARYAKIVAAITVSSRDPCIHALSGRGVGRIRHRAPVTERHPCVPPGLVWPLLAVRP